MHKSMLREMSRQARHNNATKLISMTSVSLSPRVYLPDAELPLSETFPRNENVSAQEKRTRYFPPLFKFRILAAINTVFTYLIIELLLVWAYWTL